jgi:hypothetical protein
LRRIELHTPRKLGLEGIVSKKLNAPYKSGPSKAWLKIKIRMHRQLHALLMVRYRSGTKIPLCPLSRCAGQTSRMLSIAGPVRGGRKVAMYDFHVRLGIEAMHEHSSRRRNNRWRFASLTDAEKFAHQFGGSIVMGR